MSKDHPTLSPPTLRPPGLPKQPGTEAVHYDAEPSPGIKFRFPPMIMNIFRPGGIPPTRHLHDVPRVACGRIELSRGLFIRPGRVVAASGSGTLRAELTSPANTGNRNSFHEGVVIRFRGDRGIVRGFGERSHSQTVQILSITVRILGLCPWRLGIHIYSGALFPGRETDA